MIRRRTVLCAILIASFTLVHATTAAARDFLWKATGKSGVVYLVGSIHLLTADFYPLSPALDRTFQDSDILVEEVDLAELLAPAVQMQMLTRGMLPSGQSLDKVVSPATFAEVTKRVAELGLPIEPLTRFKPWSLALTLAAMAWQKAGFDAELGLDKHFYDLARRAGKKVQGLETAEYQISRFDDLPMADQERLLADTLKDAETEMANVTALASAWKTGDAPTVERFVLEDLKHDPQMYQRLLVERNRNWMPKIEALFNRAGHAFVAVGAAHLVGPDGLIAILKAKGYAVEQM